VGAEGKVEASANGGLTAASRPAPPVTFGVFADRERVPARKLPCPLWAWRWRSRSDSAASGAYGRYLVDSASSHMLVSKIKPCMSKYKQLYCETANGSLNQLSFI
jgi:hypothetical protein